MEQKMTRPGQTGSMPLDIPYIWRHLWKNLFVIIMSACIVGIAVFVGVDYYFCSTYTATIELAVISRDNKNQNIDSALARNLNVLNSDMLVEQMNKDETIAGINGKVNAVQVPETNLVTLSASAGTAEDSLRLLKAALNSYPTLFGYFESGFMFRNMTSLSADGIQEQAARPLYYALMAAVLVLAAGIGLTVFICMSTDKIYNRRQAAAVLDVPVLGTIHLFHKKKQQKAILISDSLTSGQYGEEIDKLTTRIEHAMNKQNYKTLMVNSIRVNEGKSTVAVNLALNLSRRGKKVMLVDADMRRPAVAKIFDASVEKEKSFSEFLEGNCSLKESMRRDSRYKYLRCIFQGEAIGEPDKLLEGANFKKFLKLVSDHMDYVILDTAPIGIVRDAELIASSVDAALLVIRQDWARSVEVNDVVDVLDDTGVSVLGGVLNMAVGDKSGVSSRNKRYGSYYYGYAEKNDA